MLQKKLRSTTIIPNELYVERAADRQLRTIINDMGRPGYVLVARQMGKTNMLINMKREHTSDVVLYLDLSAVRFETVRPWFRHVIDSLIDSYPDLFKEVTETIAEQRLKTEFTPNVEYDRHLRLLLRSTSHRFIIVLDEIDSLVNASYSDSILAQIRSMYFFRVNNPEYERLTYVLSGVAEPTDLIKDKNISPFNIGEKIYLEDFCWEEFIAFLGKANLSVNSEVIDAIFDWTHGNPRMTWDICSELEDHVLTDKIASKELVDLIVEKLYLRDYDRAPIDHIRVLAEADHQIRDAITIIRNGKSDFLDHKTKSRLYLSGITHSAAGGKVVIKNKIIDAALSDDWLSQVYNAKQMMIKSASQYYTAGQFDLAIKQYELVLSDPSLAGTLEVGDRYQLALSYYYTGNMQRAIQEFEECIAESVDPSMTQQINYYMALAESSENNYQECLKLFKKVTNGPREDLQLSAKLNMIPAFLGLGSSYYQEAVDYSCALIDELDTPENLNNEKKLEFLTSALYGNASANISLGNFETAAKQLERALSLARIELQHSILLFQYDLPQNIGIRQNLAVQAAQIIIDNNLRIPKNSDNLLELNKSRLAINLSLLDKHGLTSEFDQAARYIADYIFDKRMTVAEALLDLYNSIHSEEKRSSHIALLERAMTNYYDEVIDLSAKLKMLRFVAVYSNAPQINAWRKRYLEELRAQVGSDFIEEDDFLALAHLVNAFLLAKSHPLLKQLFALWKDLEAQALEQSRQWSILFGYYEMEFLLTLRKKEAAQLIAKRLVTLTEKIEIAGTLEKINELVPQIRSRALLLMPRAPIKRDQFAEVGQNQKVTVRYGDADIQEKKFKHVEKDLREGRCVIVNQ